MIRNAHLEQQQLSVSVHSIQSLEPPVLCQAVRDLHDIVLGDSPGRAGSELIEEVRLLQKKFLESPLAPFYQVLRQSFLSSGPEINFFILILITRKVIY